MKVAVVGSRTFIDYTLLKSILDKIDIDLIISGGARGADKLAERYALEKKIETKIFYPEWDKFGKAAGFIRNRDIVQEADHVIAFWDGESKGTLSSINLAKEFGKKLSIYKF